MKNLVVIGSGGREHAIARKLLRSPMVRKVYFIPGNGTDDDKIENVIIDIFDNEAVLDFIKSNEIYYCIVGPEGPLANGLADTLVKAQVPVFGPSKQAAMLEASKEYSKRVMQASGVPTASSQCFTEASKALSYLQTCSIPVVIKADGLAAGKGVTVALDRETAICAVEDCLSTNKFGNSGSRVLIEDFLDGKEASVMAIINKGNICMLPVSSDYKRVGENNTGPNTGGMGAVSPTPVFSEERLSDVKAKVFSPVLDHLKSSGIDYSGFLYAGLMVEPSGEFKVLEFNCRLGDPETQSILLRIENDFFELMETAIFNPEKLPAIVDLSPKNALTVVLASEGYPDEVKDNKKISGLEMEKESEVQFFQAGTYRRAGEVYSKGGRIISVSALSNTAAEVKSLVYKNITKISFEGMQFRPDIGTF